MVQFEAVLALGGYEHPFEHIMRMLLGGGEYPVHSPLRYKQLKALKATSKLWLIAWRQFEREEETLDGNRGQASPSLT